MIRTRTTAAMLAAALAFPLAATPASAAPVCRVKDRVGEGIVIGSAAGTIIGGAATRSVGGAIVGGALGALGGALVGSQAADYRCCDVRRDPYGRPYKVCWR